MTTFGGAIVGFILQLLVAYYFGAGMETDAYFMAQSTSELISKLLLGGSITAVFIPMFLSRITSGTRHNAWRFAMNVFHVTGGAYLVLIILVALLANQFIRFIAPGFDNDSRVLTVSLLRVLLPSFFFLFIVDLLTSILQSLRKFVLPASLRIVAPTITIVTIILFAASIGIYALALGAVIGSVVQVTMLAFGCKRQGFSYTFVFRLNDPSLHRMFQLVYPFFISMIVTSAAGIVYRILVSDLESGSLSSLKYAEKITQLLTLVFLNSLTVVIYPLLSEKAAQKNMNAMRDTISAAIRLVFFLTVPLIAGITLLRQPLVELVYRHGEFSMHDVQMTSIALLYFVIGLTANGISSVFGHAVLAMQKTRAAVAVTVTSQAFAIALFILLVPTMKHAGLALASSLVPISIAALYFLYLTRYIPKLWLIFKHSLFLKTLLLTVFMIGVVQISLNAVVGYQINRLPSTLLQIVIPTALGIASFFGLAYMWGIQEMNEIMKIVRRRFVMRNS